jgi:hypothetical protein
MFNKKFFTVFIFIVFCFGWHQKSFCVSENILNFYKKTGNYCVGNIKFSPYMFGAYCADKILNKSEYYHNNLDKGIKTFAVGLGGFDITFRLFSILSSFVKKDRIIDENEKAVMFTVMIPFIVFFNYYVDKILNGNEYYHAKINPYVKSACLLNGGGMIFRLSTVSMMGLLTLFSRIDL